MTRPSNLRASVVFFSFHRQEAPTGVGVNSPRAGWSYPPQDRRRGAYKTGARASTNRSFITFWRNPVKPLRRATVVGSDFPPSSAPSIEITFLSASVRGDNRRNQPGLPASNLLSFHRQEAWTRVGVNSPRRLELPLRTAGEVPTRRGAGQAQIEVLWHFSWMGETAGSHPQPGRFCQANR